jgi:hypothetical protein
MNNVCINETSIESISTDKIKTKKKEEQKCAPGKHFEAGSCITLEVLIAMVEAYNKVNNNKIKLSCKNETLHPRRYKKYLLKKIGDRFKNTCDSQLCWTQQDFINKMNEVMKLELEKFTLRPEGPNGRFEWLNTININETMQQYEISYKDFLFLGAVPMDFQEIKQEKVYDLDLDKCKNDGITKFGIVFNLDESHQSGSHWVASYADIENGKVYYFDSYGTHPEKRVINLLEKFSNYYEKNNPGKKCDVRYNKTRNQFKNSECGVYSINFILELLNGKTFDDIEKNPIPDDNINMLRTKIFRNVDFEKK